ncbi:Zinc finger protein-like 1 [Blomia tropicalis]|nr:Zinc finger protein-like 1 [Blomia tropicalis]
MGLCKCPKKKVTNHFCFEHRVNVCEFCMTTGAHQTCIVGPYLQWLENSGFESVCSLCKSGLNSFPCIRLCCYHIFHMECLNNYASQLPSNTAPAGYVCPTCTIPIFTSLSGSVKSPVALALEKSLSGIAWAREGIGHGLMGSDSRNTLSNENSLISNNNNLHNGSILLNETKMNSGGSNSNFTPKILHNSLHNKPNYSTPISVSNVTSFISTNSDLSFGSTSSMRSKFDNETRRSLLANDILEDKYRTKSPIEFFSRWLRSRSSYVRNKGTISGLSLYKRLIIYGIIAFILLFVLIHFFLKFGRQSADNDPFLDPKYDTNIRNDS